MGSVNVSQAVGGRGVSATISWTTGPEVTVKITGNAGYGARAYWRIRGQGSDETRYINDTDADSGTFNAEDGKSYAFQAVWGSVSDGDIFTVNFDSSGSGGGSVVTPPEEEYFYLWVKAEDNVTVSVERTGIYLDEYLNQGNYIGELVDWFEETDEQGRWYGHRVWRYDYLIINIEAADGYTIEHSEINGLEWDESAEQWCFNPDLLDDPVSDAWIWATAKAMGLIYIDNGTTLEPYQVYIDNGTGWEQHIPHIDNGSSWDMCG